MVTRREFLKYSAIAGAVTLVPWQLTACMPIAEPGLRQQAIKAAPLLDPRSIPKYQTPILIPPAMPKATSADADFDYYEIAVRQFRQQVLPPGLPATTVWGFGSKQLPGTVAEGGSFNYPSFTIEATCNRPARVKWINELVDDDGNYLPHLLPVDQTLHWANPPGGSPGRDGHGHDPRPYRGPVPLVIHLHGAHTTQESDGYAEAWYLPDANDIPSGYAATGTYYDIFKESSSLGDAWKPGAAVFEYPNDRRAMTSWFHDHTLGMTRANVYAGPAGFYLLRGGPSDEVAGTLPGPAPAVGDALDARYYEIPLVIQDRTFGVDGSLFYPAQRAFFEGLPPEDLQIPFTPDSACGDVMSDVAPVWNPEFFGDAIVVNGRTWPFLAVEQRRYRFRLLNGCNSRFLILAMSSDVPIFQIGTEGGLLPAPAPVTQILLAPAERADVIVDFTAIPEGTEIILLNLAPDEPFGGGEAGVDHEVADPDTTGQVMQFRVMPIAGVDLSTPPMELVLPALPPLAAADSIRRLALMEEMSRSVRVRVHESEEYVLPVVLACDDPAAVPFGPTEAALGTVSDDGSPTERSWDDEISEQIPLGATEIWEIHNFTMDAHPIHVHLVSFEILNREVSSHHSPNFDLGAGRDIGYTYTPAAHEGGRKDTVVAYPGEVTRIKAHFDVPGRFVWHCHILEHEDNEMMRPFAIIP